MLTFVDYSLAILVGFLAGIFAIPIALNLGSGNFLGEFWFLAILPLIVPLGIFLGVWVSQLLSRWIPIFSQFGKFAAVGVANTAIDAGVLNLINLYTGVSEGLALGQFNLAGFSLAVINGYAWNKYWVFKNGQSSILNDFPKFIFVSVLGFLINSGVLIFFTTYVPSFGISEQLVLNAAKVLATAASLIWNFAGYKFLVFKTPQVV